MTGIALRKDAGRLSAEGVGLVAGWRKATPASICEAIGRVNISAPSTTTVLANIRRSVAKYSDACLAGKSIIDFAGESFEGSQSYLELAREVMAFE